MEDYKQLNEKLAEQMRKQFPELYTMNEMAELDAGIVVRNDNDDTKFSHFHWNGVHFNLFERVPRNVTELKTRIHFPKEQNKLSDKELSYLFNVLTHKSALRAGRTFDNVHDYAVSIWETLNKRQVDEEDE